MHSMNGLIYLIMVQCTASKCFKKFQGKASETEDSVSL